MDNLIESTQTYITGGIGLIAAYNWDVIGSRTLMVLSLVLVCFRLYREVHKFRTKGKE